MTTPSLAELRGRVEIRISALHPDQQAVWLDGEILGYLRPWGDGYMARGVTMPVSRDEAIDHMLAEWRVSQERRDR